MKECACTTDCKLKSLLSAIAGTPNLEAIARLMPEWGLCKDPQGAVDAIEGVDSDAVAEMEEVVNHHSNMLGS